MLLALCEDYTNDSFEYIFITWLQMVVFIFSLYAHSWPWAVA